MSATQDQEMGLKRSGSCESDFIRGTTGSCTSRGQTCIEMLGARSGTERDDCWLLDITPYGHSFSIAIDAIILVQVQFSTRTTGIETPEKLPVGSHKRVVLSTPCMFQGSTGFASTPINLGTVLSGLTRHHAYSISEREYCESILPATLTPS